MTSRLLLSALQAALAPAAARFDRALARPEAAQARALAVSLSAADGTRRVARIAGFGRIRTVADFQRAVPLCTADDLASDVGDMLRGVPRVLTRDPVIRFERSGGSSGASKYVPQTRVLLKQFQEALQPWLHDLCRSRPATRLGPGYWSISPIGQKREVTPGGIPVGSVEDTAYFPRPLRGLLARVFAVPGAVGLLPDVESCRYATARLLIGTPDLALVSVWNPSFLTLLMASIDEHAERLLDDLAAGLCRPPAREPKRDESVRRICAALPLRADRARANLLRASLRERGRLETSVLWRSLALVSLWTDAQASRALPTVQARFPGIELQGKGLLATEGVVTLPLFDAPAPVLAVRSHFYEFLDPERPDATPRLAHELEASRTYEVVITTAAGFLRYRVGDLVRVEGFHKKTPCLSFAGRADAVSDLVGEKIAATRVSAILRAIFRAPLTFAMLAPEWSDPPAYSLFVEGALSDAALSSAATQVEAGLCEGHPYRYARELGQLGPVRAVRVTDALRRYEARCVELGQRAGEVKPVDLHRQAGWCEALGGAQVKAKAA